MDGSVSLRELRGARNVRNAMALIAFVMTAAVVLLVAELRSRQHVTVLVPTIVQEGMIANGRIEARYMEGLARDALYSLLNVTPDTTDYSRNMLGRLAAPAARPEILNLWEDVMEEVRKRDISTVFYPSTLESSVKDLSVTVDGELVTYLGFSKVGNEPRRYRIEFVEYQGSIRVARIAELEVPK